MKKILIVDDDIDVCSMLKEVLSEKGYDALTATTSKDALKIAGSEPELIILLDILMPVINGVEILRRVKKERPQHRVIVLTAMVSGEMMREAMALGAESYVLKPVSGDDIISRIKELE